MTTESLNEVFNTPFVEPVSPELFTASLGARRGAGLRPGSEKNRGKQETPSNYACGLAGNRIGPKVCDSSQHLRCGHYPLSGNTVLVLTLTVRCNRATYHGSAHAKAPKVEHNYWTANLVDVSAN